MLEERLYELRILLHLRQLLLHVDVVFQLLTSQQRAVRYIGVFGVAPHQFAGIEFGSVARQKMQRQLALLAIDELAHSPCLADTLGIAGPAAIPAAMQPAATIQSEPRQSARVIASGSSIPVSAIPAGLAA